VQTTTHHEGDGNRSDADYDRTVRNIQRQFAERFADVPLFTTDTEHTIWNVYLGTFRDGAERQYHNCTACKNFMRRFGTLVAIDEQGRLESVIWPHDEPTLESLRSYVQSARVTGVFRTNETVWGKPETGEWRHYAVTPPAQHVHRNKLYTAGQVRASKTEDYRTVQRALAEFTLEQLEMAVQIITIGDLERNEKVLGPATWLRDLKRAHDAMRHRLQRENIVWRAIATAPAGFCHPRTSMIGTLLDDIVAGKNYDDISRTWTAKMHPLRYQRPQAAPREGAVKRAEEIAERLGIAASLPRRFARLDEIPTVWTPKPAARVAVIGAGPVFGHLLTPPKAPIELKASGRNMTWTTFHRDVLPVAEKIELLAPTIGPYCALVTAVNADAPPLFQWDREGQRNPVSWYFWHGGSSAASFRLTAGTWTPVDAITFMPSMWNGGHEHQGAGVMFVLHGAQETRMSGAALFPETMRSELHEVRSVIEAYSKRADIAGVNEPHVAGIMVQKGNADWSRFIRLRVTSGSLVAQYTLDRWS
jgi:hypothetical protein